MHIQDFLGPIYEKCPANLQKLAEKERKRMIKDELIRERRILEKQAYMLKQQKKVIRDKMEEDLTWRQHLINTKQIEITITKEKETEEQEQFIKLYQEDDMLTRKSILNFPIVPYERYK